MNTKLFSEAISEVDDKYYEEAANYKRTQKTHGWVKWSAIASCLAVVVFTAFFVLPNYLNQRGVTPPDNPSGNIANNPNDDTPPTTSTIHISMENIFLNEIAKFSDTAHRYYDPELYDDIVWDKEEVISYYGKDLTPTYIPNGLLASPKNGTAMIIADNDGNIVMDTLWLNFYHEYYEDGSPKLTEDIAACKGFSITASKIGLWNDCYYIIPKMR